MKVTSIRPDQCETGPGATLELAAELRRRVIGQDDAVDAISPFVEIFRAGLSPPGRPSGVFLLLGPTGTGKTHTVEALADVLHGSPSRLVRIDCGEFQMEHEVAKLIGAPPGYLGHRETQPMITQQRLASSASEHCPLSIVLFDEIEKAAPSLVRILLGVLDKAAMRLGDGTSVNFERSLIFMTSNAGASEIGKAQSGGFGFGRSLPHDPDACHGRVELAGLRAVKRRFPPEFVNRIDHLLVYHPLTPAHIATIFDRQIDAIESHVAARLGPMAFAIEVSSEAREFLIREGTDPASGARELKRTLHRRLMQPLARLVLAREIPPGGFVRVEKARSGGLALRPKLPRRIAS